MDWKTTYELIMDPGEIGAEARAILMGTDEYAELVETTARAIFQGAHHADMTRAEVNALEAQWRDARPEERLRARRQARAALSGSGLLERVTELEQRIADARAELLVTIADSQDVRQLVGTIRRVDRVLSKHARPDEEPPTMRLGRVAQKVAAAKADLRCYENSPEGDRLARRDALSHLNEIDGLPKTL